MPEGDVVWQTARRLHQALAGRALTRSDFRVPRLATVDLTGDAVTETVSRGKHLLTRTRNGLTVHTHLRMDGSWRVRPASVTRRARAAPGAPGGWVRPGGLRSLQPPGRSFAAAARPGGCTSRCCASFAC